MTDKNLDLERGTETWDIVTAAFFPDEEDVALSMDELLPSQSRVRQLMTIIEKLTPKEQAWVLVGACYRGEPVMPLAVICANNHYAAEYLGTFFALSHSAGWRRTIIVIAGIMTAMTYDAKRQFRARIESWMRQGNQLRSYELAVLEAGWSTLEAVRVVLDTHPDLPLPQSHKRDVLRSLGLSDTVGI